MNNTFKKVENPEITNEDKVFYESGKKVFNEIKPDKSLLLKILGNLNVNSVTNKEMARNNSCDEESKKVGRSSITNYFTNIIDMTNKYIKILSGGAVVSAVVITLFFINKADNNQLEPLPIKNTNVTDVTKAETDNTKSSVKVEVGGEVLDVDSFIAELDAIDDTYEEPLFDDSDLSADLINSTNYEI
ncbi:MAG: hypothetical protein WAV11_01470 [Minisyncoccia bacterium]